MPLNSILKLKRRDHKGLTRPSGERRGIYSPHGRMHVEQPEVVLPPVPLNHGFH